MSFFPWPDITSFHNLRKYLKQYPESLEGFSKVGYLAKVKLDGTNAAVIVSSDGKVSAQSRGKIIDPHDDNMGFAKWVKSQEEAWSKLAFKATNTDLIIFGEWVGRGIQKNVAVSQISTKVFAVFCLIFRNPKTGEVTFEVTPHSIRELVHDVPDVHILPWFEQNHELFTVTIDWTASAETLESELNRINEAVLEVENCDPWVKENFQVEGIGEGLVFYPFVNDQSWEKFSTWLFKAKGEKHKTIKHSAPAQINAEVVSSVKEFAELVLTEARLEQGAVAVWKTLPVAIPLPDQVNYSTDLKLIGNFIKWIEADVKKETTAELEASGLTWEQVGRAVTDQARKWYLAKHKEL